METPEEITRNICHFTSQPDHHTLNHGRILNIIKKFESEIKADFNEFIRELATFLGEDELGYDGKNWTVDDFKDAILLFKK